MSRRSSKTIALTITARTRTRHRKPPIGTEYVL